MSAVFVGGIDFMKSGGSLRMAGRPLNTLCHYIKTGRWPTPVDPAITIFRIKTWDASCRFQMFSPFPRN
jgi:hypothetical protein